ncbi:thiamine pyrophosphate-dependent dehydrogenase E1 component subunit alpha [Mammaliicoccus sciuri]|uniref:thiamine pyrophosphate-dependent dehydrogenase E1 component subunit alpha n=1 Tax=Mammaliicoccus sciuri TaxID=1296 RepID=UPI0018E1C00B|nr:thiamine pyrophosphate-dependent dehydrogenase E1 component subunit alpha [Mammaliicoccus sciuri]QQC96173.1 thiamine pyrophosphate-dependent dehydrogenase E1 component subunit alpha [Mammaliicoccus sciuri]
MLDYKTVGLTHEDLKEIYKWMLLGRKIDERMWLLNRAGKLPFVISCQGQEATQIGTYYALKDEDVLAPYYRDLALVTARGISAEESMLAAFAKQGDTSSGGKQMPSHFSKKDLSILTQGSCVTTQVLHAVGASLSLKMDGKEAIALATLGEGSTSQGDFHESMNFAGVHKLPFICIIENNKYAISVPSHLQYATDDLSSRAAGYGAFGEQVDGNDPIAVYEAVKRARERAINGEGPTLIEALCSRLTPHSSDDDDNYRPAEEMKEEKEKDCMIKFKEYLVEHQVTNDEWFSQIEDEIKQEINTATKNAEKAPYPLPEEALTHVYDQGGEKNA